MRILTETGSEIIEEAVYWITKYSSKIPEFSHSTENTLGNKTVNWRSGEPEYSIELKIITKSKELYEKLIEYHNDGTEFKLEGTPDYGSFILKTKAGQCSFKRFSALPSPIIYEIELKCLIVEELGEEVMS